MERPTSPRPTSTTGKRDSQSLREGNDARSSRRPRKRNFAVMNGASTVTYGAVLERGLRARSAHIAQGTTIHPTRLKRATERSSGGNGPHGDVAHMSVLTTINDQNGQPGR